MASTLKQEIPQISFEGRRQLDVEVVTFAQLGSKLGKPKDHDPFAPHRIEFYLILVATKGPYVHFIDFKSYTLQKGSALFIAKNQVHHFTESIRKSNGYGIIFNRHLLDKFAYSSDALKFSRLFNYHIEIPILHQQDLGKDNLIDSTEKLYSEFNFDNDFAKSDILQANLQLVLLKAERAKADTSTDGVEVHWLELFSRFKDMLETDYVVSRSSRYYASKLFISYKFLNDIVKKLSGKTVKAFIDGFVTTEIKRYLVSTDQSVKEISFETGFDEPANMVKFFKKNSGTTPVQFRRNT